MAMEACVRGFSYMPESKFEVSLQFIEDEELERAWKVSRRQRAKDQEQRIWEEFVKEQDIVHKAYSEDPYQFLQDLPESCLKELMETELPKLERESSTTIMDQSSQDQELSVESRGGHSVTFSDEDKLENNVEMFHIFDDENDLNQSGGDGEGDGEEEHPDSPPTVRERETDDLSPNLSENDKERDDTTPVNLPSTEVSKVVIPVTSSETVSNVIESSIYCARVKDIRLKISEEMNAIISSLEVQNVMSVERGEVSRRCRRAGEFGARFNRIYMYELQRQAHNIKRHVSQSLPHGMHTHFQSQMLRVVSLHQNTLQALQIIHKSFPATSCLRECARALAAVCAFVRDASALCAHIRTPRDFHGAAHLYNDELVATCNKLEETVLAYEARVTEYIQSTDTQNVQLSATPSSSRTKKSKKANVAKTGSKSWSTKDTDARLSMYSLDTLRVNVHPPSNSRGNTSNCGSKGRRSPSVGSKKQKEDKSPDKTSKKSSRRPLMRAPQSGAPRPRHSKDMEITTMVEAVKTCASSQAVSRSPSPREARVRSREITPRYNSRQITPRLYNSTPRNPSPSRRSSPRMRSAGQSSPPKTTSSPRVRGRRGPSPKPPQPRRSTTSIPSDTFTNTATAKTPITPVIKIQCAKKTNENEQKNKDKLNTSKNSDKIPTDRSRASEKNTDRSKFTERSKYTDRSSYTEKIKRQDKVYVIRCPTRTQREKEEKMDTDIDMMSTKMDNEEGSEKEFCGVKELTDNNDDYAKCYAKEVEEEKVMRSRSGMSSRCDVPWLLRQLCSGDPASLSKEKITGAKNAQLLCIRGGSPPQQPSTPQLLRILEETIQKQAPKPMYEAQKPTNTERFRLNFNIGEAVANRMFQYRTKFVQHMLTSPLYANSAVGKPWEMIGGVSDKIIDEVLTSIAKEMQIKPILEELFTSETH